MRIISITGGKGGIGKTTISINLALMFAKMRKKVMLVDADFGLANIDVLLGLNPKKTLYDVMMGQCDLKDICLAGPCGVKIIPSSSGIQKMADLSSAEYTGLIHSFSTLADEIDIMIVDMASGVTKQVIDFTNASQDIILVICNEPSSLMDSYAVIKILHQKYLRKRFGIIVNKVKTHEEGFEVFERFQAATQQFIHVSMNYLGDLPQDDYIGFAAKQRKGVVEHFPNSKFTLAMKNICQSICLWNDDIEVNGGINFFIDRLVHHQ